MTTDEDLRRLLKSAFDSQHAPESLVADTLAAIEAKRAEEARPRQASAANHRRMLQRIAVPLAVVACLIVAFIGIGVFQTGGNDEGGSASSDVSSSVSVTPPEVQLASQAVVDVDVNPSFELVVDRDDTVSAVYAVNADAEAVLAGVDVVGQRYEDTLKAIFSSEAFQSYLTEGAFVEINVTSDDEELASRLVDVGGTVVGSLPCEGSCMRSGPQLYEAARQAGMGMGRYRAACELIELDPSVTMEECSHMSMRELRDRIAACQDGIDDDASDGEGTGTSSGGSGAGSGGSMGGGASSGSGSGSGSGSEGGMGSGHGSGHHRGMS